MSPTAHGLIVLLVSACAGGALQAVPLCSWRGRQGLVAGALQQRPADLEHQQGRCVIGASWCGPLGLGLACVHDGACSHLLAFSRDRPLPPTFISLLQVLRHSTTKRLVLNAPVWKGLNPHRISPKVCGHETVPACTPPSTVPLPSQHPLPLCCNITPKRICASQPSTTLTRMLATTTQPTTAICRHSCSRCV